MLHLDAIAAVRAVCRPNEIKRAARNLVQNALRYGVRARVAVRGETGRVVITVDDDGPGPVSYTHLTLPTTPYV